MACPGRRSRRRAGAGPRRGRLTSPSTLRASKEDPVDEVVRALLQDQVRSGARRLDVVDQIRTVRALPDALGHGERLGVGQLGVAVEVGLGALEGAVAQGEEAL